MSSTLAETGALFRNEQKERESQPDYTGRITIGGTEYRLAAWINEAQTSGKKYLRIKASPFEDQAAAAPAKPAAKPGPAKRKHDDLDDEIPF